ncbi:MAG TPA: peptidylprolyl isomerase [Rhodopila sp.]
MRSPVTLARPGLLRPGTRLACALVLTAALPPAAPAQPAAPTAAATGRSGGAASPGPGNADPVVGSVEGHQINLSDLGEAAKALPENLRGLPFDTLYPVLLDRMIDHEALVMMARRRGLEDRPQVQREIVAATERILEGAYLAEVAAPQVTEQAIQARYNRQYANRSATEEVRARHILVATEAEARKVLEDLRNGADFASIASVLSKDPDASKGGDLGFFRREQVWPGFADAAFSLQPGQVGPDPIRNEFGWHVIKVEEKRLVAPPSFPDVHDQLRQELLAAAIQQAVANARSQLVIHRFNLDGTELNNASRLGAPGGGGPGSGDLGSGSPDPGDPDPGGSGKGSAGSGGAGVGAAGARGAGTEGTGVGGIPSR